MSRHDITDPLRTTRPLRTSQTWIEDENIHVRPDHEADILLHFMYTSVPTQTVHLFLDRLGVSWETFIEAAEAATR